LLIVSDGILQYIPFAALPIPDRSGDPIPLIVEHEIVDLPSASILAEIRRQQTSRPRVFGKIALLADPVFDAGDPRVASGTQGRPTGSFANKPTADLTRAENDLGLLRNGHAYLPRLLYTRAEATAVMALVPPESGFQALDFDASRATAMSDLLARYRVIHFATHGLLNNKHPELSGLVFSLVNRQGKRQDGFLKLQDVYDLNLHADLVVLSGCETGLGAEISGEGLISLTRGFIYAGASRVVASLWSVSDSATASLMAAFYNAMEKDNMRPAEALRAAQIQMLTQRQWRSPYYWAAFQIQGEWR
jgi:CHAT domain-containing protein